MIILPRAETIVFAILIVTLFLAFARLVRGPSLPDRVVALDLIAVTTAAFIAVYAIDSGQPVFLDAAIVLGLITFWEQWRLRNMSNGGRAMNEVISNILMLIGAVLLLLAAVGILRMPDLFTRMQPATKGTTLGIACTLLAVAVHFADSGVTTRALAAIAFFFLTAPVTAHLISRASYFVGVPLWKGTVIDELRGRYNPITHVLDDTPTEET